jgi:hypothetical protein
MQVLGVAALAVQRVGGDYDSPQVSHGVKHGREGGQLVGVDHLHLGQRQMLGVIEDRDQLGLPTVAPAGAAQRLAVDGQHRPVLATRSRVALQEPPDLAAGQDPAGQGVLQRGRIDRCEHSAERGGMWRRTDHGDRLLGVRSPLGDRRVRAGAGQHGADREQ